ncbi:MAG: MarR family transcriptional regulator [Beijerinckiaceae bacterium]|nr:MAG: MarR family transcriptional regulator [Beijerinckiaceae bacterium]
MNLIARRRDVSQNLAERTVLAAAARPDAPMFELIELMFFAYRDFVRLGFGRAHHRVLHFVARRPGLTIAELLDILQITKQSLNRVLKELIGRGYVEARPGMKDRRQRQLFPTARGEALALEVALLQSKRLARVFGELPEGARAQAAGFLFAMAGSGGRDKVAAMTGAGPASSTEGPER